MNAVNNVLSTYMNAIQLNKVTGETPSVGETGSFKFLMEKENGNNMNGKNITMAGGDDGEDLGFSLPSTSLFNASMAKEVLSVEVNKIFSLPC